MTYYRYHEWANEDRSNGLVLLDVAKVEGIALHWPAIVKRLTTVDAVMASLRAIRRDHIETRGYADIAYQLAFDQMGNTYQLRGVRHRSAANGDRDVNERYGAFVLMVAEDEQPKDRLVRAVNFSLNHAQQDFYKHAHKVVGHKDIRPEPTECPGRFISDFIESGIFHF